jgi:hypothetical protein
LGSNFSRDLKQYFSAVCGPGLMVFSKSERLALDCL